MKHDYLKLKCLKGSWIEVLELKRVGWLEIGDNYLRNPGIVPLSFSIVASLDNAYIYFYLIE